MAAILLLSLLSGFAALIFEAVFLRQCAWLLGSSITATALVLAAFLGGMAAGAFLLGRQVDRHPRPLALYGWIETGAGLSGAVVVWLLGSQRATLQAPLRWIGPGAAGDAAAFLLALGLLLVPAFLIGATLPALSRVLVRSADGLVGRFGLLYAINTLGGALGALTAGFLLFERLGISRSGALAALIDCGVGVAALLLARTRVGALATTAADRGQDRRGVAASIEDRDTGHAPRAAGAHGLPSDAAASEAGSRADSHGVGAAQAAHPGPDARALRMVWLLAAGVGGFCALGYEVLWTRLLSLPLRSFSYSFTLMLALFLAGIVLGGFAAALLSRVVRHPAAALGWAQVGVAVSVASSLLWLPELLGARLEAGSLAGFIGKASSRAGLLIFPPTILSGIAFPFAARAVAGAEGGVGRSVGSVYAANTLGAVAGALAARFTLLPSVGASRSLAILAAVNAAAGAAVVLVSTGRSRELGDAFEGQSRLMTGPRRAHRAGSKTTGRSPLGAPAGARSGARRLLPAAAVLLACACLASIALPSERFVRAFLEASRGREKIAGLLFFHEGATDTIAIVNKDYGFYDPGAKTLLTNSISMTATARPIRRYMAAEGHLPALFARSAKRALVLCVGTGITLGAVASHPGLASIDAVDLSEGVMRGLPYFAAENGRAFEDPRVRLIRADGRHFLELGGPAYDLITLEPPPPIVAGSSHLYSFDFYRACLARLAPGGVVAQWLPLHSQSLESARMTARTFAAAFPHAQLWLPSLRDGVLVGSIEPIAPDLARLRRAWSEPMTRASLEAAWLETPEALLGTFLLDREGLLRWAGSIEGPGASAHGGGAAVGDGARRAVGPSAPPEQAQPPHESPPDGSPAVPGGEEVDRAAARRRILTDERPWMEFFDVQGRNMKDRDIAGLLAQPPPTWSWVRGLADDQGLIGRIETESRALRLYVRGGIENDAASSIEAARTSRGTGFFLTTLGCAPQQFAFMERSAQWAPMAQAQRRRCAALLAGAGSSTGLRP